MTFRKVRNSITAAMMSAVMATTVLASPVAFQMMQVTAAGSSVTLIASEDDKSPDRGAKFPVSKDAKSVTFDIETTSTGEITFGVSGFTISEDPWWIGEEEFAGAKKEFKVTPKNGKASFTYTIPGKYVGKVKEVDLGLWYPKEGVTATVTVSDGGATTNPNDPDNPDNPGPQEKPESQNTKSGNSTFVDNHDGTATITTTLTSELYGEEYGFPYTLTADYDEEGYLDEYGNSTWTEDDPINSHKFSFGLLNIDEIANVDIQSFNYTIESDEPMKRLLYGGGINVEPQSPGDTEYAKGKNGYWYNDQGDEDVEKFGKELDALGIEYNKGGYNVTNAGTYAEIVWDVPKDVQPYVTKNPADSAGIQFWYAEAANPPEGEDYGVVSEVRLTAASCTYTRTMTVPFNNLDDNIKIGKTLIPGDDDTTNQYKFSLKDLDLKERDKLSAVKFHVTSSADLTKLTCGVGISVGGTKGEAIGYWYMPGSITILNPEKNKFEIMWLVPESYRDDIDLMSESGNLMFGAYYAGEDAPTITLDSIDAYEFLSKEEELKVTPEKFTLTVGEEKKLVTNVDGCTFSGYDERFVTVSDDGVVKAVGDGITTILVTTPEGQEVTVTVNVDAAPTTPAPTTPEPSKSTTPQTSTTPKPTVSTSISTTKPVDPNEIIDWSRVMYGDVNLNGEVNVADVVKLNLYLLDAEANYINATARENANCAYDKSVDLGDSAILMSYVGMDITYDKLGPQGNQIPEQLKPYLNK